MVLADRQIVVSNQRNILGNPDAVPTRPLHEAQTHIVVTDEYRTGLFLELGILFVCSPPGLNGVVAGYLPHQLHVGMVLDIVREAAFPQE